MKRGVVIVNTSRGALVDSSAVEEGLMNGQIGGLAMVRLLETGDGVDPLC